MNPDKQKYAPLHWNPRKMTKKEFAKEILDQDKKSAKPYLSKQTSTFQNKYISTKYQEYEDSWRAQGYMDFKRPGKKGEDSNFCNVLGEEDCHKTKGWCYWKPSLNLCVKSADLSQGNDPRYPMERRPGGISEIEELERKLDQLSISKRQHMLAQEAKMDPMLLDVIKKEEAIRDLPQLLRRTASLGVLQRAAAMASQPAAPIDVKESVARGAIAFGMANDTGRQSVANMVASRFLQGTPAPLEPAMKRMRESNTPAPSGRQSVANIVASRLLQGTPAPMAPSFATPIKPMKREAKPSSSSSSGLQFSSSAFQAYRQPPPDVMPPLEPDPALQRLGNAIEDALFDQM
jgi:hypothetical protein